MSEMRPARPALGGQVPLRRRSARRRRYASTTTRVTRQAGVADVRGASRCSWAAWLLDVRTRDARRHSDRSDRPGSRNARRDQSPAERTGRLHRPPRRPEAGELSAEQRAWDAAAKLKTAIRQLSRSREPRRAPDREAVPPVSSRGYRKRTGPRRHGRSRHAGDRARRNHDGTRQRVLRAARHADHQRARRAERRLRDAAEDGWLERERARAYARAGLRHRRAQSGAGRRRRSPSCRWARRNRSRRDRK